MKPSEFSAKHSLSLRPRVLVFPGASRRAQRPLCLALPRDMPYTSAPEDRGLPEKPNPPQGQNWGCGTDGFLAVRTVRAYVNAWPYFRPRPRIVCPRRTFGLTSRPGSRRGGRALQCAQPGSPVIGKGDLDLSLGAPGQGHRDGPVETGRKQTPCCG